MPTTIIGSEDVSAPGAFCTGAERNIWKTWRFIGGMLSWNSESGKFFVTESGSGAKEIEGMTAEKPEEAEERAKCWLRNG